jgi:NAD+ synthase (glutamine-hydrolysing)
MVYAGHNIIAENGTLLSESKRFEMGLTVADVDLQRLLQERRRTTTFPDPSNGVKTIWFDLPIKKLKLNRKFASFHLFRTKPRILPRDVKKFLRFRQAGLQQGFGILTVKLRLWGCRAVWILAGAYCYCTCF